MNQPSALRPVWLSVAGPIDQSLFSRLLATFAGVMRDGFDEAHLLIQSNGGFISDGVAISNFLTAAPLRINTYNMGHVGSIAVPVFLSGTKRIAAENATFMIHCPFVSGTGGNASAIAAASNSLRIDEDRTANLLRNSLTLPDEKWRMYATHDLTLTAQEFVQYGGAHEIGLFSPPAGAPFFNI
ncbi:MAG: ATP-dependent Clp protease proteolytic subunit [Burkholderiaceae bacterium]|nr:ATP-dependent Clp protease proteolytic subunit [Burkholderiaceae bacterium]